MHKKSVYATACCLLSLLFWGLSHAEEKVDAIDARNILIGNTVEGKIIERDVNYQMYFHPLGKLIRLDSKDVLEKGAWEINTSSEVCITITSKKCRTIKKRGDGEFDLYGPQDNLELTIDKVIIGNPNKMKP